MPNRQVRRSGPFVIEAKAMFPVAGSADGRSSFALFEEAAVCWVAAGGELPIDCPAVVGGAQVDLKQHHRRRTR
jgi:hypothetical protein